MFSREHAAFDFVADALPRQPRKRTEVPWLARMISIADTYDVMTSRDSYRDPVSAEEAIAELRRVSGAQLDGVLKPLGFVRKGVTWNRKGIRLLRSLMFR